MEMERNEAMNGTERKWYVKRLINFARISNGWTEGKARARAKTWSGLTCPYSPAPSLTFPFV